MKHTTDLEPTGTERKSAPVLRWSAFALGTVLASGIATAASSDMADAKTRYQQERSFCMSGKSQQDQATCLKEAGAAYQEARRGRLTVEAGRYQQNQRLRCNAHQDADDREDCLRRMRGEGTVSRSFEGGSVYRELRTTVPAK